MSAVHGQHGAPPAVQTEPAPAAGAAAPMPIGVDAVLALQRTAGNRATARALARQSRPRGATGPEAPSPLTRLEEVRRQIAQLEATQRRATDAFAGEVTDDRQRTTSGRDWRAAEQRRFAAVGDRQLFPAPEVGNRVRRVVRATQSGPVVTLHVPMEISYVGTPDLEAQRRAAVDIPRIEAAIRDVWQTDIRQGEYAGLSLRVAPSVRWVASGARRDPGRFAIVVRQQDSGPSAGDALGGEISLAAGHLDAGRVIVVAHELTHLFGFIDTYLDPRLSGGRLGDRWAVARPDPAGRPDPLGLIDPYVLQRAVEAGGIAPELAARQQGPVRLWEEEASTVLRVVGVPLPPPGPSSDAYDPSLDVEGVRRGGDAALAGIRASRRRVDESVQWLRIVETIVSLRAEEQRLRRQLEASP